MLPKGLKNFTTPIQIQWRSSGLNFAHRYLSRWATVKRVKYRAYSILLAGNESRRSNSVISSNPRCERRFLPDEPSVLPGSGEQLKFHGGVSPPRTSPIRQSSRHMAQFCICGIISEIQTKRMRDVDFIKEKSF